MVVFLKCLFKRRKIVKLWNIADELIDKECDFIRVIKTVRVMKTVIKTQMKEWTKFKKYIDPNAHKRVIDINSESENQN